MIELARLIILFIAAFLVLFWLYRLNIEKLLIAPGILAIVIGLAMQDLVGNIIAGLALQVGKPYAQGDWLQVERPFRASHRDQLARHPSAQQRRDLHRNPASRDGRQNDRQP